MQRRGQCKFFARGTCLKGESCDYVHDLKMSTKKKECIYFQRGCCSFGSRCKFEHSKSSLVESSAPFSPLARGPPTSVHGDSATGSAHNDSPAELSIPNEKGVESGGNDNNICKLAVDGNCTLGESCLDIHGDLCATCGKYCLHPLNPEDRKKHATECKRKQALERSQQIECSVCLERVLSKATAFERKFGLLSECDHAFCIACIKKWRSSSSSSSPLLEEDNSAARACPICRKVSYYVIPSPIWHSSTEEKQDIINQYKAKLKSIDCRYFNFGNGSCCHGNNCFYKHEVKPGSSRPTRPFKANRRHSNIQHRGLFDDNDPLGFGDLVEVAAMEAMLNDFENMFFLSDDSDEAISNEALEDDDEENESPNFMSFLKKQIKWQMLMSGEYEEEDFLEPWQRDFMYAQMGYEDYDDYLFCQKYGDFGFGFGFDSDEDGEL